MHVGSKFHTRRYIYNSLLAKKLLKYCNVICHSYLYSEFHLPSSNNLSVIVYKVKIEQHLHKAAIFQCYTEQKCILNKIFIIFEVLLQNFTTLS